MTALAFADPVFESQAAFRRIMRAMAAPGTIFHLRRGAGAAGAARARRRGGLADARRFRDAAVDRAVVPAASGASPPILPSTPARRSPPSPDKAAFALIDLAADGLGSSASR